MPRASPAVFPVLSPRLQVSFFYALRAMRELYFGEALGQTVGRMEIGAIDKELGKYVARASLARVASFGLRGEVVFPVPSVLQANPALLGYYRLLLGLSQKEFYNKGPFGRFKRLEEKGAIPAALAAQMVPLCRSLIGSGQQLVNQIDNLSVDVVDDLQLLTLGPQLRGSENTKLGQDATKQVFDLIRTLVRPYVRTTRDRVIELENDSHRTVFVEFSSDPDIRITEELESGKRPLVSIEIKGGADASNVHNRLGEAEKSHQKAKNRGFFEFWTILRVKIADAVARRESPTTSHFFHLDGIRIATTDEHTRFRALLGSVLSIRIR
jgi:hypothetical protein